MNSDANATLETYAWAECPPHLTLDEFEERMRELGNPVLARNETKRELLLSYTTDQVTVPEALWK